MVDFSPVKLAYNLIEPTTLINGKTPIIFLHGMSSSKEFWDDIPQIVANKTGRKVYNVDARNHGDSEWSDVFSFDINADDLIHFMDLHNIQKAIIIGHSMGGISAIRASLIHPDRIECFVTEDSGPKGVDPSALEMAKLRMALTKSAIQQVPPDVTEDEAKKIISEFIFNGLPPQVQVLLKKRFDKGLPTALKRTADGHWAYKANIDVLVKYGSNLNTTETGTIGIYKGPALFIYGKESPFRIGAQEDYIKQLFPAATLVGIDNATHTVHTDCPQEFTDILLNFLLKQ